VPDGRFLVRSREAGSTDEYILSVNYRGKGTHHLVKREGDGSPYDIVCLNTHHPLPCQNPSAWMCQTGHLAP